MSDVTPVARVAISSAVLFIPADGVDRDPDFSNPADLAAVKRLSAAEYIKDRKEYKASAHRLYCPCCFDKGHLSRHYGVRNHDREVTLWNNQKEWRHFPDSFQKWPEGADHRDDCDFANRYTPLNAIQREILRLRRGIESQPISAVTLPISGSVVLAPPHARSTGVLRYRAEPRASDSQTRLPSIRDIQDFERVLRAQYYDSKARAEKILKTPYGFKSLDDLYLNTVQGVHDYCDAFQAAGQSKGLALVSLRPNRIPAHWEGHRLPSVTGPQLKKGSGRRMVVMFNAQNAEVEEHLVELFKRKRDQMDKKLLAFGEVCVGADGRPNVLLHRAEQIMSWDEPDTEPSLF